MGQCWFAGTQNDLFGASRIYIYIINLSANIYIFVYIILYIIIFIYIYYIYLGSKRSFMHVLLKRMAHSLFIILYY